MRTVKRVLALSTPIVELIGSVLAVTVLALHGWQLSSLWIYAACMTLLALAVIDLRTYLLPDMLTLPLLWAGLAYQLLYQPVMLSNAVLGAMAGYLVLWSFYWLFKLVTGKEGMGYGDFKLLAALGAWLGWSMLPLLLIVSAGLGALIGLVVQMLMPRLRGQPCLLGLFLALAGWVGLLVGDDLMALYLALLY